MTNTYNRRSNLYPLSNKGFIIYFCTIYRSFFSILSHLFIIFIPRPLLERIGFNTHKFACLFLSALAVNASRKDNDSKGNINV